VWVWVPVTSHHITITERGNHTSTLTSSPPLPTTTTTTWPCHDNATRRNKGRGKRCGQAWVVMPMPNNRYVFCKLCHCGTTLINYTTFAGTTTWPGGFDPSSSRRTMLTAASTNGAPPLHEMQDRGYVSNRLRDHNHRC